MKTQPGPNVLVKAWRSLIRQRPPAHDPFLSLNITIFNFSSGRDRLLRKQGHFLA